LWAAGAQIAAIDDPADLQPDRGPVPYGARPSGRFLTRFDPEGELGDPQAARHRSRLERLRNLTRRRPTPQPEPDVLSTFLDTD
jgi:hypothetical protein